VQTYYNLVNLNIPRNVFRRRKRLCGFGGLLRNVLRIVFRRRRRLCGIGGIIFKPEKFFPSRRVSAREKLYLLIWLRNGGSVF